MSKDIHTIPVPHGMSAEQAWEMIQRGDELKDPHPRWATLEADEDGRLVHLIGVLDDEE